MTAKESSMWLAVIKQEEEVYRALHPDALPPPSAASEAVSAVSFSNSASEYDVEVVDEETKFIKKRAAASPPETVMCAFNCKNSNCPHQSMEYGFAFDNRNARNNHQFMCAYQDVPPVNENKPPVVVSAYELPNMSVPGVSELAIAPNDKKSIDELMSMYENSMNKGDEFAVEEMNPSTQPLQFFNFCNDVTILDPANVMNVIEPMFPNQINNVSADYTFGSGFNMTGMDFSNPTQVIGEPQLQNNSGSWFF